MTDSRFVVRFDDYPHAFGAPSLTGVLRSRAEDFVVEERLGFEPAGEGPHVLLWVEKRGANTDWVAKQFARRAGCRPMDVGYSGMKDRHALARQWFSVPAPKHDVDWRALDIEGVRVLDVHAHHRKLRRGAHDANRFVLTVRNVSGDDDLDARIEQVRANGVPNYFGPQRFGRAGDNVARAVDGVRGGIHLSAARSFLFNAVLAERVRAGNWNRLLPGEAVQLDGSGSFFLAETLDETLHQRLDAFDIHPSGPMLGRGELPSAGDAAALEKRTFAGFPELPALLEHAGLRQERRALRLAVRELAVERPEADVVVLAFELAAGAFATSAIRELITTIDSGAGHAGTD